MQASWTPEREEVTLEKSKFLLLGALDLLRVCHAVHSLLGQTCFLGQLPRSESWLEAALRYQPGIKLFGYPWSLC